MSESLLSVGIDLGTTTTQMIVSRLQLENTAAPFTIPHMEIRDREILYRSGVHFTPLLSADVLDADAIQIIIRQEYERAGIVPEQVQTGAVIITGETARKDNAREVLRALSDLAGEFVVATAGPALESVLAARGAGADRYAKEHGVSVLHFDIGGGTSNLALYGPEGQLLDTGCLNVGGRLMKFDPQGIVTYVSPVLKERNVPGLGERATPEQLQPLLEFLVGALEEAAGLRPATGCLRALITDKTVELPERRMVFSFSGGVADLIGRPEGDWLQYGDLGVLLGRAIRNSKLCQKTYILGQETLRATVVGAGSYSTELSGSTISYCGVEFPLQNIPAVTLSQEEETEKPDALCAAIQKKAALFPDENFALSLRGNSSPTYQEIVRLAKGISGGLSHRKGPAVVILEEDMGKALGQALRNELGLQAQVVCLDGLHIPEGSYLDIAAPVAGGTTIPVVVKTLAFS